jgi:hypothetical protein
MKSGFVRQLPDFAVTGPASLRFSLLRQLPDEPARWLIIL